MNRNFKLLSQKLAALWSEEVEVSEAKRAQEALLDERPSASDMPIDAKDASNRSLTPSSPDRPPGAPPAVLTKVKRRLDPSPADSSTAAMQSEPAFESPRVSRVFRVATPVAASAAGDADTDDPEIDESRSPRPSSGFYRRSRTARAPGVAVTIRPVPVVVDHAAMLAELDALHPSQRLATLLLSEPPLDDDPFMADEYGKRVVATAEACDADMWHALRPLEFWEACLSQVPATSTLHRGLGSLGDPVLRISLLGLTIAADDVQALLWIPAADVRLFDDVVEAAVADGEPPARLASCSFALKIGGDAFFEWLSPRAHEFRHDTAPREQLLTTWLHEAIDAWERAGHAATPAQLGTVAVMLQSGALLDRDHLLRLAPMPSMTDPRTIWHGLAAQIHRRDPEGLAALQLMISAARFSYDHELSPADGAANAFSRYVAGNHPVAVDMFVRLGFDPLQPEEGGMTPRDHGERAGATDALAVIDLHLAKRRIKALQHSADRMREIDRFLA